MISNNTIEEILFFKKKQLNMLTLSKLLVAAAIVAAVLTPVNASPSKVKRGTLC